MITIKSILDKSYYKYRILDMMSIVSRFDMNVGINIKDIYTISDKSRRNRRITRCEMRIGFKRAHNMGNTVNFNDFSTYFI